MSERGPLSNPLVDSSPILFPEGFEKAFERLIQNPWYRSNHQPLPAFRPQLDVTESDRDFVIKVEVPGMEEKDVQVEVSNHTLTLRGEKRQEREEKSKNTTWSERTYGSFLRRIPLSEEVDAARITATMKQGVLTVTLPKTEKARQQTRKVEIKKA